MRTARLREKGPLRTARGASSGFPKTPNSNVPAARRAGPQRPARAKQAPPASRSNADSPNDRTSWTKASHNRCGSFNPNNIPATNASHPPTGRRKPNRVIRYHRRTQITSEPPGSHPGTTRDVEVAKIRNCPKPRFKSKRKHSKPKRLCRVFMVCSVCHEARYIDIATANHAARVRCFRCGGPMNRPVDLYGHHKKQRY